MKVVREYRVSYRTTLQLPANATPLGLRWLKGDLVMDVLLDPDATPYATRRFQIRLTNEVFLADNVQHIGSATNDNHQQLHLFELLSHEQER